MSTGKDETTARPRPRPAAAGRTAAATTAEAAVPTDEHAPDKPGRARPSRWALLTSVLALLLAGAVAAIVVLAVQLSDKSDTAESADRVAAARSSALTTAKQYAVDFTTYDYRTLSKSFAKVESELTGTFKTQYTSTTAALKATIVKYKAKSTSKVLAVAAQSVSVHDAVVLAFVDQTISNTASTQPQVDRNRVQMTLHRDDAGGRWLIRNLQLP